MESNLTMKNYVVIFVAAFGMLAACSAPRDSPADVNEQPGNPNAKPASETNTAARGQDAGDKAGKDIHTDRPERTAPSH